MNARNGFENFFSVTKIELVLFVTRKLTAKRMEEKKSRTRLLRKTVRQTDVRR